MADLRDVAEWIDGLERGVLAHQHSPQAGFTAFPDRLDQFDEDGNRVATLGRLPDGTFGVQPVAPVPPPSPTGPVVECDMNQVAVSWNGMFADEDGDGDPDVVEPSTLSHIAVFSRYLGTLDGPAGDDGEPSLVPAEGEPDVARGSIAYTAQAGGQLSFGPVVETGLHEVWLCAVGTDGGVSAPSERARFEVTYGLMQGELDEVRLRADGAMLSADGKNSVWRQDAAPVPSEEFPIGEGDIWFHTGDSNMPHTWDGDKWVSVADERVDAVQSAVESMRGELEDVLVGSSGAKLFYQPTRPGADDASVDDLWFDTSAEGKNLPHRWDGSEWVSVADERVQAIKDAQADLETDLNTVRESADGKSKITWSPNAPSGDGKAGDTWFRTSGNNIIGHWRHSGSGWVSMSLAPAVIPNLDAGKINSGIIDAERIGAASITADKILVGGAGNLLTNPGFTGDGAGWGIASYNPQITTSGGPTGEPVLSIQNSDPPGTLYPYLGGLGQSAAGSLAPDLAVVEPGKRYAASVWVRAEVDIPVGNAGMGFRLRELGSSTLGWAFPATATNREVIPANTWAKVEGEFRVPTDAGTWNRLAFGLRANGALNGERVEFSAPVLLPMVGATLIEDGAITTEKIATGAITAESGVIGSLDLGKATVGELDGARIQAGSVTADKLLVGGERNLIPNGDLRLGDATGWMDGGVFSSDAPAGLPGSVTYNSQTLHWRSMGDALFEQGDEIGFEVWLKADKPGSRIYVGIKDAADKWLRGRWGGGSTISYPVYNADVPTVWTLFKASMVYEGPDSFKPSHSTWFFNHTSGSIRDAAVSVAGVRLYKKTGSTYIADGAITTEKIAAGAITAESGVIGSLDLGKATVGQLNGDRILANSISTGHIRSGAVTATSLAADAINGKTITGATVQTSTGYPRVAMDKQGLHAWDQAGRRTFHVDQGTGEVSFVGNQSQSNNWGEMVVGPDMYSMPDDSPAITFRKKGSDAAGPAGMYLKGSGDSPHGELCVQGPGIKHSDDLILGSVLRLKQIGKGFSLGVITGTTFFGIRTVHENGAMYFGSYEDHPDGKGRGTLQVYADGSSLFANGNMWDDGSKIRVALDGIDLLAHSGSSKKPITLTGSSIRQNAYGDMDLYCYNSKFTLGNVTSNGKDWNCNLVFNSNKNLYMWSNGWQWTNYYQGSATPNVHMTASGWFQRTGSSRRWKLLEEPIERGIDSFEDRLLSLEPKTWFDKAASERLAELETLRYKQGDDYDWENEGYVPDPLRRIPGLIAEDVHEAGLDLFVEYDEDGLPSGLMYDRLGVALIPVVARQRDRISQLEGQLAGQAERLEALEASLTA